MKETMADRVLLLAFLIALGLLTAIIDEKLFSPDMIKVDVPADLEDF
jgi:hypothetical protein